ncbi:hypothetical protein D3C76_1079880 [compost metagenome]
MPMTTNDLRLALAWCTALLSAPGQAALESLDNQALSQITGQSGINLRLDVMARIDSLSWNDDGGSLSLRNIRIDNGCGNPGDSRIGSLEIRDITDLRGTFKVWGH